MTTNPYKPYLDRIAQLERQLSEALQEIHDEKVLNAALEDQLDSYQMAILAELEEPK